MPLSEWKRHEKQSKPKEKSEGARIAETLESAFDRIPQGFNFRSDLPGIEQIGLVRPETEQSDQIHVIAVYAKEKGGKDSVTFTLHRNGTVTGKEKLPKELHGLPPYDVAKELMEKVEALHVDRSAIIGYPVLPPGETLTMALGEPEPLPQQETSNRQLVDPKRFEHLLSSGAHFWGVDKSGLGGYWVFVYDGVLVLENENIDNAVYIVTLPEDVGVPRGDIENERTAFFEIPAVRDLLSRSKQDHMADETTTRITHRGEWQKRLDEEIKKRLRRAA